MFRYLTRALILGLLFVATFLGISLYYLFCYFPSVPFHPPTNKIISVVYTLHRGTSLKTMVRQLESENILNHTQAQLFYWWIRGKSVEKHLQAGEYSISLSMTPAQLLAKLVKGEVIQHALTFIEGSTVKDMLFLISKDPSLKKTLEGKSEQEILAILGETTSLEGLFFPDTYYFTANMLDVSLLERARKVMQEKLKNIWENRDPNIILTTPYEALILASIIEKEAVIPAERYRISGVFHRRLAKNMRLQADPTVMYGLQSIAPLTRENLQQDTPFNTYLHKGLPPSPIALPGKMSLDAACHPEQGDTFYFVAKGDGTHVFSATLAEHNLAVAQYQREAPKSE